MTVLTRDLVLSRGLQKLLTVSSNPKEAQLKSTIRGPNKPRLCNNSRDRLQKHLGFKCGQIGALRSLE
jgi:hypothetical protein